jgi:hypothetical protein
MLVGFREMERCQGGWVEGRRMNGAKVKLRLFVVHCGWGNKQLVVTTLYQPKQVSV